MDFSDEALLAAEKGFNRLTERMQLLSKLATSKTSTVDVLSWKQTCYDAMNDDFNSPILIASLFEGVRLIHLIENKKETISETDLTILKDTFHSFFVEVLGLQTAQVSQGSNMQQLNGAVNLLIQLRNEARANKNFALSDQIRDQLAALNIQLKDGKEGTTFSF